jgi:hypothetical protein
MTEAGTGAPEPIAVEVLVDGRGPDRPQRHARWAAWSGPGEYGRLLLGGLAVAAVVVVTAVVGGLHPLPPRPDGAGPEPGPQAPHVQLLLDQYSYASEPGGFSLQLSLVNYGSTAIDVLAARLPQAGARPVPGPGGDLAFAAPITLVPNISAAISVPVRVTCPGVLTAPLASQVDVTLGHGRVPVDVVHLALAPLGNLLDDARHAACGVASASASVYPTYVAGSLHLVGSHLISGTLRILDVGDAPASVVVLGADPTSVAVSPTGAGPTVAPGRSAELLLRWQILDCAAAQAVRWPSLRLTITVPTSTATNAYGLDQSFGTAWRDALAAVCRHP